jgi:hypothetical protein
MDKYSQVPEEVRKEVEETENCKKRARMLKQTINNELEITGNETRQSEMMGNKALHFAIVMSFINLWRSK